MILAKLNYDLSDICRHFIVGCVNYIATCCCMKSRMVAEWVKIT